MSIHAYFTLLVISAVTLSAVATPTAPNFNAVLSDHWVVFPQRKFNPQYARPARKINDVRSLDDCVAKLNPDEDAASWYQSFFNSPTGQKVLLPLGTCATYQGWVDDLSESYVPTLVPSQEQHSSYHVESSSQQRPSLTLTKFSQGKFVFGQSFAQVTNPRDINNWVLQNECDVVIQRKFKKPNEDIKSKTSQSNDVTKGQGNDETENYEKFYLCTRFVKDELSTIIVRRD